VHDREVLDPQAVFNERATAFVLDWLILGLLAYLAAGGGWAGIGAWTAMSLVNQGLAGALTGYSMGKAMTGVRVARVDTTESPGIAAGLLRWLLLLPDFVVGIFFAQWSDKRQRLGDRVARTWVVGLKPSTRARTIVSVAYFVLCLVLIFLNSVDWGLIVSSLFIPVAVGATVIVVGVTRSWAAWPWLVGLGVALIPACYAASVRLCDNIAGTCISGAELEASQQAIYSVIAFVIAIGVLMVKRSTVRDLAFAVLVLGGQIWLVMKLMSKDELSGGLLVMALIVLELGYEAFKRVRASREGAAAPPATAS
jgi:uncharacterized RDD family membrane protein YckC